MQRPMNPALAICFGLFLYARVTQASAPISENSETQASSNSEPVSPKASTSDVSTDKKDSSKWSSDFSLFEEYRLRIASHALRTAGPLGQPQPVNQSSDQRLRLLGDGQISGMDDHFRAVMSGALWIDLDGSSAPGAASVFATPYDNAQPWAAIYALSAEWQGNKTVQHVRIGRQNTEHGLPLTFDGASLAIRALGRHLQIFGFGGRTVHFFESTPGLFENWVASTGAVLRPNSNSTFEFDSRLIHEPTLNANRSRSDYITNHSYGVSAALSAENLHSKVYSRGIDRHPSHLGGAFAFQSERLGLGLDAHIHAQVQTLGEVVESENPLYSILGPSLPYVRFRFEAWKDFRLGRPTHLSVHVGWRGRQLVGNTEQPFNRNSGAIYLNTQVEDFIRQGVTLGGSVEHNYVPYVSRGERMLTLGGYGGYRNNLFKAELGTYYQRYKIIYYQSAEELQSSRTVYGSLAFELTEWLEVRTRYEIDIFDRYLQSFFFSARQEFQ